MRVSQHFNLGRTQSDLDFVDVDIESDVRLYVDPRALRSIPTNWGQWCVSLLQDFFSTVLTSIVSGDLARARQLLGRLREPNETRLGLSQFRARGRGLGPHLAGQVANALSGSVAVYSGLLEDLEDTILMIEGISSDLISDIATNVIREPLTFYTEYACNYYGIPPTNDVDPGQSGIKSITSGPRLMRGCQLQVGGLSCWCRKLRSDKPWTTTLRNTIGTTS